MGVYYLARIQTHGARKTTTFRYFIDSELNARLWIAEQMRLYPCKCNDGSACDQPGCAKAVYSIEKGESFPICEAQ